MEVTEDWQKKSYQNGQFLLNNISDVIKNVFYQLEGFNYEKNLNGYTFKKVTSRTVKNSNNPPTPPIPVNKLKMKLTGSAARLRKDVVNGQTNIIIPNDTKFDVVGLYSW